MRAGPGEVAPALGRAEVDTGCVAGSPCIEAVNYLPANDPLAGWVLVDPAEEGRFCFKGSALGDTEGTLWFEDTPATVTLWSDSQACGRVAPGAVNDGLVHLENAGGLRSNPLPYVAPARDPVFSLRTDRPMQTGDVVHIEAENLGTVGHTIIGGTILGLRGGRLSVLIDAAFPGRMTFRKRPSTAIWWRDIAVFPTQLVGAVAGPNELGGVSGHLGTGATWTLDGQVLPSGPTGGWFEALSQGPHTLRATYNGRTRDVGVAGPLGYPPPRAATPR